jgi:competence protein ComEC
VEKFPGPGSPLYGLSRLIGEGLAVTTAAVAGVLPLIAYYFGYVALAGGVATLVAAPVLPLIIFGALLTGGAAMIHPAAAIPFAAVSRLALSFLLAVVELFARVPTLSTSTVDGVVIWAFYAVLAFIAWRLWRWQRRQEDLLPPRPVKLGRLARFGVPSLVLVGVLASTLPLAPAEVRLQVSFLDVGQGDAVYIRTPAGQDILIDGGPSPQRLAQELSQQMPFWDRTLELVISTHADADHLTGLVEALRRYEVKQIVHPGIAADTALYAEWRNLIAAKNVPETVLEAGQRIRLAGGLELEVFNPFAGSGADTNVASLVIGLALRDISFLFTGDITAAAEEELVYRRLLPDATVLKVSHHGSGGSTSGAFLAVARPELAVIQVGKNGYGHPKPDIVTVLDDYCLDNGIFRTDEAGTVTFLTDGRTLWLKQ